MTNNSNSESLSQVDSKDVERIRDIIFGPQMRHYEHQFQTLQRDLERLQQTLDNMNEQVAEKETSQSKTYQTLRKEMRQADDNLRAELRENIQTLSAEKIDRLAMGDLFIELGNQLKSGGSLGELLHNLAELTGEQATE